MPALGNLSMKHRAVLVAVLVISSFSKVHAQEGESRMAVDSQRPTADSFSSSVAVGEGDFSNANWGVSYFNFASADMQYVNRGGGSWGIYQYFSLNKRLGPGQKFSIRPAFSTQTAGTYDNFGNVRPMKTELGDLHVAYSDYSLASFPGEWDLAGMFYLYLPTSESSQNKKWATRVRSWLILSKVLNHRWSIAYNAKPEYFFNTQKAFRNERTNISPDGREFTTVKADSNKLAKLDHYLQISRYLNRYVSPQLDVGLTHEWNQESEEADSRPLVSDKLKIAPNAEIRATKTLRFIVGVENQVDLRDRRGKPFRLFQEEDNQYYLMTFWTVL